MIDSQQRIRQLYRDRPRSVFLWLNGIVILGLFVVSWILLDIPWNELLSARRIDNLQRFGREIYPFELRDQPFSLTATWNWFVEIWHEKGWEATYKTLGISLVAILIAGTTALLVVFPAARNVASAEPFLPSGKPPAQFERIIWAVIRGFLRSMLIFARAIPEYVWAFLLIAMLGPSAWPAILALALHNFGILGKLGAEVVENTPPIVPAALRGQGLSRWQICLVAIFPVALSKWLLFFFYRWETCIREATVLGMLGIASLGFWVNDSRARDWYDEMVVFILLGAVLVMFVDLVSAVTRRFLRNA